MVLWRCALLARRTGGMLPQRKFACYVCKVVSEMILDHFSRFVNIPLQLDMHAIPKGGNWVTKKGRKQMFPALFQTKEIVLSLTVI